MLVRASRLERFGSVLFGRIDSTRIPLEWMHADASASALLVRAPRLGLSLVNFTCVPAGRPAGEMVVGPSLQTTV